MKKWTLILLWFVAGINHRVSAMEQPVIQATKAVEPQAARTNKDQMQATRGLGTEESRQQLIEAIKTCNRRKILGLALAGVELDKETEQKAMSDYAETYSVKHGYASDDDDENYLVDLVNEDDKAACQKEISDLVRYSKNWRKTFHFMRGKPVHVILDILDLARPSCLYEEKNS